MLESLAKRTLGDRSTARLLLALAALSMLTGCPSYAVSRYAVSSDNVAALRKLSGHAVKVGAFRTMTGESSSITCRMAGPVETPDGEPFSQYIRKALVAELARAELYSEAAPVQLTGQLEFIDFSTTGGGWQIALTVSSSNGKSLRVQEDHNFAVGLFYDAACTQAARAFMPAVQELISRLVGDPEFRTLVGLDDGATASSGLAAPGRPPSPLRHP